MTKKNKFANEAQRKALEDRFKRVVYDLVHLLKDYSTEEILAAAAYLEKDKKHIVFLQKADEAHQDAHQLIPYITTRELGYE